MIRRILACGNDKELLATRALVLATAPFQVEMVIGVDALGRAEFHAETKLVVLCHSLSEAEQAQAIRQLQQNLPQTPILTLSSLAHAGSPLGNAVLNSLEGPRSLLSLSQKIAAR